MWPLRPRLDAAINGGVPTPLKLQTVGDVMFYFDYKHGVCRWDGETWDWIDFPPGCSTASSLASPPPEPRSEAAE